MKVFEYSTQLSKRLNITMPRMTARQYQALVKTVEQLRVEEKVQRDPVSKSGKQLVDYVNNNQQEDYLVSRHGPNPFKSLDTCPCTVV